MDEEIDEALKKVLAMVRANCKPEEALKFSQAALNLAHTKSQLKPKVGRPKGTS